MTASTEKHEMPEWLQSFWIGVIIYIFVIVINFFVGGNTELRDNGMTISSYIILFPMCWFIAWSLPIVGSNNVEWSVKTSWQDNPFNNKNSNGTDDSHG